MTIAENDLLIISDHDYQRLLPLTEKYKTLAAEMLDHELGRAEILPNSDLPGDVVSMNSSVTFMDVGTGEQSTVDLVYPMEADIEKMKISILSPVGTALIGLRVGGRIDWPLPGGSIKHLEVISVTQPEKTALGEI